METKEELHSIIREQIEETGYVKKGKVLFIKTEEWVVVKTDSIGKDLFIKTDETIRNVYVNGELIK